MRSADQWYEAIIECVWYSGWWAPATFVETIIAWLEIKILRWWQWRCSLSLSWRRKRIVAAVVQALQDHAERERKIQPVFYGACRQNKAQGWLSSGSALPTLSIFPLWLLSQAEFLKWAYGHWTHAECRNQKLSRSTCDRMRFFISNIVLTWEKHNFWFHISYNINNLHAHMHHYPDFTPTS